MKLIQFHHVIVRWNIFITKEQVGLANDKCPSNKYELHSINNSAKFHYEIGTLPSSVPISDNNTSIINKNDVNKSRERTIMVANWSLLLVIATMLVIMFDQILKQLIYNYNIIKVSEISQYVTLPNTDIYSITLPGFGIDDIKIYSDTHKLYIEYNKLLLQKYKLKNVIKEIDLPFNVDKNNIKVTLNNGMLKIYIPRINISRNIPVQ